MKPIEQAASIEHLQALHMPATISTWPLAPGWILSLLLLLGGGYFAVKLLQKIITKNAYRRTAIKKLDIIFQQYALHLSDKNLLVDINTLLKSVAMAHYPNVLCSRLSGTSWVLFLNQSIANVNGIETQLFSQLSNIYTPKINLSNSCREQLYTNTKLWLKKHHEIVVLKENSVV